MKYLDFSAVLDGDAAHIAFLSTFQFDPDFFERRLLRSSTLSSARRIVVFLDARQWFDLLRRDVPARWLNRRYLVVPVQRSQGVFHPKLSLLLTEAGGQVLCGSNNLTRSGCASNLELLNAIPFNYAVECSEELDIAREAFAFFERAAKDADSEIARIVVEWIQETKRACAWLTRPVNGRDNRPIRLVHTYDGSIWDRLIQHLDGFRPKEFFIASPFHNADGEMCRRLANQWPSAKIELLVQQGYTSLAVKPLKKLRKLQLSELQGFSRRIHAKLLAWRSGDGGGCLVGSANFTSAAFDGRNVEACLLLSDAGELVDALFDRQLARRSVAIDDFVPGVADELESETTLPPLRINSAILSEANRLRISYSHRLEPAPTSFRLTIRIPGEARPRLSINLPKKPKLKETVELPENALADSHGTLLATLVAEIDGTKLESLPVWVIHENQLTYEPGEGSSSSKNKMEETGEGLPEYLDELGKRDGAAAVVDYLRHLNIRFHDGGASGGPGEHKFHLKIRDPFQADVAPGWLIDSTLKADDLKRAIYDFVERHEKQRLLRHANRGNINGMENFLDIFTTIIRILCIYYQRGVVKREFLSEKIRAFIEIATVGRKSLGENTEKDAFQGYLTSIYNNLDGDVQLLHEACEETHYLAEVRAALLIAQKIAWDWIQHDPLRRLVGRPKDQLPYYAEIVKQAVATCHLNEPRREDTRRALEGYRMFSEEEMPQLIVELPERLA
jgi:hypothetical protein